MRSDNTGKKQGVQGEERWLLYGFASQIARFLAEGWRAHSFKASLCVYSEFRKCKYNAMKKIYGKIAGIPL